MKVFAGGAMVLGVIVVVTLVIIDLARTAPKPGPGQCMFQDNLILPDRCISSCPGVDCPTTMTRPYFWFWTEAAGCPDAVICG